MASRTTRDAKRASRFSRRISRRHVTNPPTVAPNAAATRDITATPHHGGDDSTLTIVVATPIAVSREMEGA